jgi:hypothetical protein
MTKVSFNHHTQHAKDDRRLSVYYDKNPSNAVESNNRICMVLKSNGQVIRISESEALDLMIDMSKALKWKTKRTHRY